AGRGFGEHQCRLGHDALRFGHEISIKRLVVDLELAAAGAKEHAGHARFATTRTVILNQFCHLHSVGRTCSLDPSRKFAGRSQASPLVLTRAWRPGPRFPASGPRADACRPGKLSACWPWHGPA